MSTDQFVPRFHTLQARLETAQFAFGLDPQTLLPISIAAAAAGKSEATFRSDLVRRPAALPKVTRRNGRVFVRVCDLLEWRDSSPELPQPDPGKRRRGRPTKAESIARQSQACGGAHE